MKWFIDGILLMAEIVVVVGCSGRHSVGDRDAAPLDAADVVADAYDTPDFDAFDGDFECNGLSTWGATDIETIAGYETLVGDFYLNSDIDSTEPLRCLTYIQGSLNVTLDEVPDNLRGFRSLREVSGGLEIGRQGGGEPNLGLTSLEGFASLESVGMLRIEGALDLEDITDLRSLGFVGGEIAISRNPALQRVDEAMEGLSVVGGSVTIEGNNHLDSLEMLRDVTIIGGSLSLRRLPFLNGLEGLRNLRSVGEDLEIFDTGVSSLSALNERLVLNGGTESDVRIIENPFLPTCEVEEFVERLRANGWQGTVETRGTNDDISCD